MVHIKIKRHLTRVTITWDSQPMDCLSISSLHHTSLTDPVNVWSGGERGEDGVTTYIHNMLMEGNITLYPSFDDKMYIIT